MILYDKLIDQRNISGSINFVLCEYVAASFIGYMSWSLCYLFYFTLMFQTVMLPSSDGEVFPGGK
jgi:hypothetical protein